jgi:hypothetical protein
MRFEEFEKGTHPRVAVINQELARKTFGGVANAMGRNFKNREGTRIQVVGIVEDGKYNRLMEEQQPAMFLPMLQSPSSQSYFVVRSSRDPRQLGAEIRNTVRGLDAGMPLYIEPLNKQLDTALFASRMSAITLGVLGMMGAMLSITGIFGMAEYSVSKRLRDLGIRMALGAQRKEVLQAALGRALKLLAFGSVAGLLLGILASRVLAAVVFPRHSPRSPGLGLRRSSDGGARASRYVDPSPTRAFDRSCRAASRRVNPLYSGFGALPDALQNVPLKWPCSNCSVQ